MIMEISKMNAILNFWYEYQFTYELLIIIVPIAISILLLVMEKRAGKEEKGMTEDRFVVHQGKITVWIGIICTLFFGTMLAVSFIYDEKWWAYAGFSAFMLLGVFLAVYSISWKVSVKGDEIRVSSLFKKARIFTFDTIKTVKVRVHRLYQTQVKLVVSSESEKLMCIESHCVGYNLFVSRLQQKGIEFLMTDEHYGI